MNHKKIFWRILLLSCLTALMSVTGAAAAAEQVVWMGPAGGGGWNGFMQIIMQQDYRLQMSNGNPYWNTLMLPIPQSSVSGGMSSHMGLPAFGFCPVPGQCYMVLIQRPMNYNSMSCPPLSPAAPGQISPNQQGKPNSLW